MTDQPATLRIQDGPLVEIVGPGSTPGTLLCRVIEPGVVGGPGRRETWHVGTLIQVKEKRDDD